MLMHNNGSYGQFRLHDKKHPSTNHPGQRKGCVSLSLALTHTALSALQIAGRRATWTRSSKREESKRSRREKKDKKDKKKDKKKK